MSLERELQRLNSRIQEAREAIETAYATRVPDASKDALFARLEALLWKRLILRLCYSVELRWQALRASIESAWIQLARKVRKTVETFMPALQELEEARKRSRPAFWRGLYPVERSARVNVPGMALTALPANRRPVLPGRMKQKGRG